jgi:replication factor A1
LNYFFKEHGVMPQVRASAEKAVISAIKEPGKWVDLQVKVLDLWEPATEAISQTGLVGDGTGSMKFVKWTKAGLPNLELGKSYLLKNVVTDEFQGRFSVKLNRTSQIELLETEVEAKPASLAAQPLKIVEISEPGRWVDLTVKVTQLWEANSDSISQSGLIGDDTGTIKFVKWVKAELPNLEEGKSYRLKNLVTDEFQGRFSVKLNRTSQIEPLDIDIEVGSQSVEFTGALVDVQKGSGLIKRCPVCKRSLAKGVCSDHGKVEGTYDLRIKAVIDDGRRVQDVLINRETTERLVGLTLDAAKQMAMEALDHEVVRSMIEGKLVGRYFSVTGPRVDRYILVESINEAAPVTVSQINELMATVEV